MATKIILKKSVTSGSAPVTGDIDAGEVAINLADRKVFTKDNANVIIRLDGAYISNVAPANPGQGDLFYDTTNNLLKSHNGTAFVGAGYSTFASLEDTVVATPVTGQFIRYNGTAFANVALAEADISGAGGLVDSELTNVTAIKAIDQGLAQADNVDFNDLTLAGNLVVNGTTTSVNSNEVNIGDAIILLNSDEVAAPTQNAGFEVERGTLANVSFVWNETDDAWDLSSNILQNVTLDGGSY